MTTEPKKPFLIDEEADDPTGFDWPELDEYFRDPPLAADGWLTTRQIAERYGKTIGATSNRMSRLHECKRVQKIVVGGLAYWRKVTND